MSDENTVSMCMSFAHEMLKVVQQCGDCLDLYIDYTPLRHPYATVIAVLRRCPSGVSECEEHLHDVVAEAVVDIDSLFRGTVDIYRVVSYLRIRCTNGWIEYGYTISRSSAGVAYTNNVKELSVVWSGKKMQVRSANKALEEAIGGIMKIMTSSAKIIAESEGIL